MLKTILLFLKHPIYEEDANTDFQYRSKVLFTLLGIGLVASIILGALNEGIQSLCKLDLGVHAIEESLDKYSPGYLFFLIVIVAPLFEELICRGPMFFFKNKRYFKYVFYILTLLFGFYHITNFEINSTTALLSPLLVAPQLSLGAILGFIRVRFGLWWAIALHAIYNCILIGPILVLQLLDISLE